jgi:hypothetical protein
MEKKKRNRAALTGMLLCHRSFVVFINVPSLVKNMSFLVKVGNDIFSNCTIFKYKRKDRGMEDQIAGRIEERAKLCYNGCRSNIRWDIKTI